MDAAPAARAAGGEEKEEEDDGLRLHPAPGPTAFAKDAAKDIVSAFLAFIHPDIQDTVIEMTNLEGEGRARAPDGWRRMDRMWFEEYLGSLVLSGVYKSRGEACESLWDPDTGQPLLRSGMSLKTFRAYSSALQFDDRRTRESRRRLGSDKLAAARHVWDLWRTRLPEMYVPSPDVTVDKRLVPFRGQCRFRQYMLNKPARYGLKIWVACDARSSYAWQMQMYLGKPDKRGPPEKNLACRVIMDLTRGLGSSRRSTPIRTSSSH